MGRMTRIREKGHSGMKKEEDAGNKMKKVFFSLLLVIVFSCNKTDNLKFETHTRKLEFYLVADKNDPLATQIDEHIDIRFRPDPELDPDNLKSVVFDYVNGEIAVNLTEEGRERLREVTEKKTGHVMMIFFDNRVIDGFMIREQIDTDTIRIKVLSDEEFWEQIEKEIEQ